MCVWSQAQYKAKRKDVPLSPIISSPRKADASSQNRNPLSSSPRAARMKTGKGGFDRNVTIAAPAPEIRRAGDVATGLLLLGTLPFPLAAVALALAPAEVLLPSYRGAAAGCLVSYAAMILAYIGGVQQAAAVHADGARAGAWLLVVAAIGVALLGWGLVVRSQLRAAGVEAGGLLAEPKVELLLLAVVYGWQAWLEACATPWVLGLPARSRCKFHKRSACPQSTLSDRYDPKYTSNLPHK